jgi:predicted metal-dependent enzyme (double-stranded beta helix superfamily)
LTASACTPSPCRCASGASRRFIHAIEDDTRELIDYLCGVPRGLNDRSLALSTKEDDMCDFHDHAAALQPLPADEYVLDTPLVREFVNAVKRAVDVERSAVAVCASLEPAFSELLATPDWLPEQYQHDVPNSGMGGGIGQWLLYRSADRSLCLFSLVVPPCSKTPIHDHLAWGLIGLYRGNQDEEIYRPHAGSIELVRRRPLKPGDFYVLLPPADDVHRVRTTSDVTSVSIHLLANDTGCAERHTFDEVTGVASPFRSGYANAVCPTDDALA